MDLSFLNCRSAYNHLEELDESKSFQELEVSFEINDDLFQGEYENGLILDVGWFELDSVSNLSGPYQLKCFLIRLIRNSDWTTPAVQVVARSFSELRRALEIVNGWAVGLDR